MAGAPMTPHDDEDRYMPDPNMTKTRPISPDPPAGFGTMPPARVELCWQCHEPLGAVHVHARPPHAKVTGGGWQRWHPTCVPPGHETAEPRPDDDPDAPCCGLHYERDRDPHADEVKP
jgi:hypothetical protein